MARVCSSASSSAALANARRGASARYRATANPMLASTTMPSAPNSAPSKPHR